MNRDWINTFYTECGREVSLAYDVLNQTTNWGVTLTAAVLGASFISALQLTPSGELEFFYPTTFHWFYAIVAWIVMTRFFVRSCIALVNMYRWNTLIYATSKVLSLSDENPEATVYKRNLARKIKAYFYDWYSPIPRKKVVWNSLKLMYIWFFFILLFLIVWGAIEIDKDWMFWAGIAALIISTGLETCWFFRWRGLKYHKVESENEQQISDLWLNELEANKADGS